MTALCHTCDHWKKLKRVPGFQQLGECERITEMVSMPPWRAESYTTAAEFGCVLHSLTWGARTPAPTPPIDVAHARTSDPTTSHEAATSITNLTKRRADVLRVLNGLGPMPDVDLVTHYARWPGPLTSQSASGIRSRRHELVTMGLVREMGDTTIDGRKHKVWDTTTAGSERVRVMDGAL